MTKMEKKIPKREIDYQNSFKKIPDDWLQGTSFMIEPFKYEPNELDYFDIKANIYEASRKIYATLIFAYSNMPFFIRHHNKFADRLWQKSVFLDDAVIRLASFKDLIVWQYRLGFGVHDSRKQDPIGIEVNFKESELDKLPDVLSKAIRLVYNNDNVREITRLGNMIKHGWAPDLLSCHYWRAHAVNEMGQDGMAKKMWSVTIPTSIPPYNKYIREYLKLPKIEFPKTPFQNDGGKTILLWSSRKLINHVIRIARNANNKLIDLAILIDRQCPFNKQRITMDSS